MFHNVPQRCTSKDVLAEFIGSKRQNPLLIDFLYLPWDPQSRSNPGYLFVNFLDAEAAASARKQMEGKRWERVPSKRKIKVTQARVQGFKKNLMTCSYKIPPETAKEYCPLVFENGQEVDFRSTVKKMGRKDDVAELGALCKLVQPTPDYEPTPRSAPIACGYGGIKNYSTSAHPLVDRPPSRLRQLSLAPLPVEETSYHDVSEEMFCQVLRRLAAGKDGSCCAHSVTAGHRQTLHGDSLQVLDDAHVDHQWQMCDMVSRSGASSTECGSSPSDTYLRLRLQPHKSLALINNPTPAQACQDAFYSKPRENNPIFDDDLDDDDDALSTPSSSENFDELSSLEAWPTVLGHSQEADDDVLIIIDDDRRAHVSLCSSICQQKHPRLEVVDQTDLVEPRETDLTGNREVSNSVGHVHEALIAYSREDLARQPMYVSTGGMDEDRYLTRPIFSGLDSEDASVDPHQQALRSVPFPSKLLGNSAAMRQTSKSQAVQQLKQLIHALKIQAQDMHRFNQA